MFEEKTYDALLSEAYGKITRDVDKREGSILYDAIAPSLYMMAQMYYELDHYVDLFMADTAVGEFLDRKVSEIGLKRKQATSAVRKIETNGPVEEGTRFGMEDLIYTITDKINENEYKAVCDTKGNGGNLYSGKLDNIDNLDKIEAVLTDVLESGTEEESDDELRERYFTKVQMPSASGNIADYENWALSVKGVGRAKVWPLWNGNGTVKILILNSENEIDDGIIAPTASYIEQMRPIGASVTVDTPSACNISITATLNLLDQVELSEVIKKYRDAIIAYFRTLAFHSTTVSYAKIGALLLNVEGVNDYSNLLLNGKQQNVEMGEDEVPILEIMTLV